VICSLLWLTIRHICQKVLAALDLIFAVTKHAATLSFIAVRVCYPDRAPLRINR
jgi:hypothetical protein